MLAGYSPFFDANQFQIYQKILLGKVDFPRHFEVNIKDLIRKLLQIDRSKRIGLFSLSCCLCECTLPSLVIRNVSGP